MQIKHYNSKILTIEKASDPDPGSVKQKEDKISMLHKLGKYVFFI